MAEYGTGVIILFLLFYFFPTLIASLRGKKNTLAIFAFNLFLGWTVIGWIISLVWSLTKDSQPQTIIVNNNVQPEKTVTPPPVDPTAQSTFNSKEQTIPLQPENKKIKVHQDKINQLQQLKQLFDSGVLSEDEFNGQKKKVLESK